MNTMNREDETKGRKISNRKDRHDEPTNWNRKRQTGQTGQPEQMTTTNREHKTKGTKRSNMMNRTNMTNRQTGIEKDKQDKLNK